MLRTCASHCSRPGIFCGLALLALIGVSPAASQCVIPNTAIPWPDGCSVPGAPSMVKIGLNYIFLDACNNHDRCYGECNLEFGPYHGLLHKVSCDTALGAEMTAACFFWAGQIAFPAGDFQTADDFLKVCTPFAGVFVAAVSTPPGIDAYTSDQCFRGCNEDACNAKGCPFVNPQNFLNVPPSCGLGFGPGFCYLDLSQPICNPPPTCSGGLERFGCYPDLVSCTCECSPIVVDVEGHGFHFTSIAGGVHFDLQGSGVKKQMAWTARGSGNAFLALDRNGNGVIDDGTELFGNFTKQPDSPHRNGFLALAEYDKPENGGNGDGVIDSRDKVFSQLLLWIDENHNGISEPNELHSLAEFGIESIDLRYHEDRRQDRFGNRFKYRARVRGAKGEDLGRWAYDVYLLIHP